MNFKNIDWGLFTIFIVLTALGSTGLALFGKLDLTMGAGFVFAMVSSAGLHFLIDPKKAIENQAQTFDQGQSVVNKTDN